MREKLNQNPMAQVALVAVLLVAAAFLLLSSKGGGEEEAAEGEVSTAAAISAITAAEVGPGQESPRFPRRDRVPAPLRRCRGR